MRLPGFLCGPAALGVAEEAYSRAQTAEVMMAQRSRMFRWRTGAGRAVPHPGGPGYAGRKLRRDLTRANGGAISRWLHARFALQLDPQANPIPRPTAPASSPPADASLAEIQRATRGSKQVLQYELQQEFIRLGYSPREAAKAARECEI